MNGHKIICGSLAWVCVAGAAGLLLAERDQVGQVANMFFAGICILLAFVFVWMGWWDDAVNDNAEPGRTERIAATTWLWTRRLLCWSAALVFLGVAVSMIFTGVALERATVFFSVLALGGMSLWVGLKGGGHVKSMSDDAAVHAERRKRYGWWF
ncbi:hypothetical protein [Variovorax guangxiensis]|uniref:Uncharacterized protein n=1 Tax=Variovorax guangxiensis TaxID=1775474 RepID=A0A840G4T6_9BURK|nr:hypothetical protein [Variovorax guangxiensis]MBB4224281.1 hypothetical protein [Variovorax guangxiensis]